MFHFPGSDGPMSPMSGAISQAAFDASFQQNLSVMKLFPGHPPSTSAPLLPSSTSTPLLRGPSGQATALPQVTLLVLKSPGFT